MQDQTGSGAARLVPAGKEGASRKVLILTSDIYDEVGGGQTAYRNIIEKSPGTLFYYFTKRELASRPRPVNAVAVQYKDFYYANTGDLPAELTHFYSDYLNAWQMARSFAEACPGVDLDVVDTPDYQTTGTFIRGALERHGVRVGVVSLALHGTISSAIGSEWGERPAGRSLAELRSRERLQYRAADSRYALSAAYAAELRRKSGGHGANLIDPLLMVGPFVPAAAIVGAGPPDIAFVGRRERRKGPDLLLDALWSLDRRRYGRAMIIGADSLGASGVGSAGLLETMARARALEVDFVPPMTREDLDALFRSQVVVYLPSRYDQFNLVALEALRFGAPVLISRRAGVAGWIRETLPDLSDLIFDVTAAREGSRKLRDALDDPAGLRARIVEVLQRRPLVADPSTLDGMYAPAAEISASARDAQADIGHRLDSFNRPRELAQSVSLLAHGEAPFAHLPRWKRAVLASPLRPFAHFAHTRRIQLQAAMASASASEVPPAVLEAQVADRSERARSQLQAAVELEGLRERMLHAPERTPTEAGEKLAMISSAIPSILVSRALVYRDMARLERRRPGGDVVAATYGLRLMRWMGRDAFRDMGFVQETLSRHGFVAEAEALHAQYGGEHEDAGRIGDILSGQLDAHRTHRPGGIVVRDDRRGEGVPRVSVIVSLYNAASKLEGFLTQLGGQTLMERGAMEVILVDSGSPADEHGSFRRFADRSAMPILYVRTAQRETIQAAWNRGIGLARSPYLSFLGVDEGVHPDAYLELASRLDAAPGIDWVMADSIVTNVDRSGGFVSDVMAYDRTGYDHSLSGLETCYLSWVGGLYRASIHDRIGLYDETFRAAGDTEFKNRGLPFLQTAHVPRMLGLFLNYPEERTTQHPRAEIEDQRAWYLHRSCAGAAYRWRREPVEAVEAFFRRCLSYRKSYTQSQSTDFDMAYAVARHLVDRGENPAFAEAALQSVTTMLERIRALEGLDLRQSPAERRHAVLKALAAAKQQEALDADLFRLERRPRYEIFNDNRYEQHWYSWSA